MTCIDGLQRFQAICELHGAVPVYVVTYVAAQDDALVEFLRDRVDAGKANVGVHLHTWNTPPFEHTFSLANTFQRNLPVALEKRKLNNLKDLLENKFGRDITIHKAGRYGLGVGSIPTLAKLGFRLDLSLSPLLRTSRVATDDPTAWGTRPFYLPGHDLTFIPNTVLRLPRNLRALVPPALEAFISARFARFVRMSVEGVAVEELLAGIDQLSGRGDRVLSFSIHSSSFVTGGNPYSRTHSDVDRMLYGIDRMLNVVNSTTDRLRFASLSSGSAILQ